MTRPRPSSPLAALLLAAIAAATSWGAMLSWRPLSEDTGWTVALLTGSLLVGAVGATGRWVRLSPLLVAAGQTLVAVVLVLVWTTGSPLPTPDAWASLGDQVRAGLQGAQQYAVPVPATVPMGSLFLVAGLATAVFVDLFAVGLSRVGLAGICLLAVHVLPANLDLTPPWIQFVLVALGFLALLHLGQVESYHQWDRGAAARTDGATAPPEPAAAPTPARRREAPYASTPAALTIAVVAVAAATAAGALVPLSAISIWDGAGRGSGDNGVAISNPLIDMRRDLTRGWDMPLLRVSGDSPRRPTYVRLATLTSFNGREWSSGDRTAPAAQGATGELPDPVGVDADVPRQTFSWRYTASQAFESRWLPTPLQVAAVDAPGDWRYDLDSRDFVAWDKELTTAGLAWQTTEVVLDLKGERLDEAPDGRRAVDSSFTDLPDNLPKMVEELAEEVAGDAPTQFRQARALQSWFRREFTYSLENVDSVGNDDLVAFLSEEGREGYCEQFAASMAVMARSLGIPSRVAVGFLSPEKVSGSTWVFSAHDLHAWPELFFPGSGWVRFEPTPADRTSGAPGYSTADLPEIEQPEVAPSVSSSADPQTPVPEPQRPEQEVDTERVSTGSTVPWTEILVGLVVTLLVGGAATAPRLVRDRRRTRRLASSDPEDWWAELHDTALDLGLAWPRGRSVRATGAWLTGQLGRHWPDARTDTGTNLGTSDRDSAEPQPDAAASADTPVAGPVGVVQLTRSRPLGSQDAVARLVGALEQNRYSRLPSADMALQRDAVDLREELLSRATRGQRVRATWLPRSLWS